MHKKTRCVYALSKGNWMIHNAFRFPAVRRGALEEEPHLRVTKKVNNDSHEKKCS